MFMYRIIETIWFAAMFIPMLVFAAIMPDWYRAWVQWGLTQGGEMGMAVAAALPILAWAFFTKPIGDVALGFKQRHYDRHAA